MTVPPSKDPPLLAGPPPGLWARFAGAHLYDYNAAATRLWLLMAAGGALALGWTLVCLAAMPPRAQLQVAVGLACVVLAAWFPVHIPRSKYSLSTADIFVFSLLAMHGAPAAALAAGVETLVGVLRTSKRLTSHVSSPATAMMSMLVCGLAAEAAQPMLVQAGWHPAAAGFAALCAVALPYFAGVTLPLLAVVAAKNNRRLSWRDWIESYAWVGALFLLSAAVAGVLAMNAHQFGPIVFVVAASVTAAAVALVHITIRRSEADFKAQAARLAGAEREAALNQERFTAAFTHAAVGMAIVSHEGTVRQVNHALCALLDRVAEDLLQRPFSDLLHPGDQRLFAHRAEAVASGSAEAFSMELRCRSPGSQGIWVSLHCGRFTDPATERSGLIYQLHDITSRRLAEDQLHHVAFHDSLTDLANRNCFNERLGAAVERNRTDASQGFAVMFLDLDRFKLVNDSLGHPAGNALLCEVARRLSEAVRPGDLVARLGGDEFAILLEDVQAPDTALALAQRLQSQLSAPMIINGAEVAPMASIGITFSDLGYRTADEVLRDADLAMYDAKLGGNGRVSLFNQSMHERVAAKLQLEGDLRRALSEDRLSLVYQPLFNLRTNRLIGFEVLSRWVHPERGPISPDVFIALAEEGGHIEALTAWIINQAAGQLAAWQASYPAFAGLSVHVNISGRDLGSAALVPLVRDVLLRHALAPEQLTLEITETTLMGKLATALDTVHALRDVGVKFSIDDFGTGYSSLAYLSTLPIDSLKIDRSFVAGMADKPQNVEIVRAVLTLGRSLGQTIIAEGIETAEQLQRLEELGVDVGQGYLLARPMPPEQVLARFAGAVAEATSAA